MLKRAVILLALAAIVGIAVVSVRTVRLSGRVVAAAPAGAPAGAGLSAERLRVLLAVEDPRFYEHHGVDFRTPGAGWTTITQGLVKIHGYGRFEPGFGHWRKVEQSLVALVVDRRIPKDGQLAMFLDAAYLGTWEGREVRGFDAAARAYFGVPLDELSDDDYLTLVAMLPAPDHLHVLAHPDRNAERVGRIERMLAGKCRPAGWTDVYYEACAAGVAIR
jgi:membrane carboxypeptidase/penicillin-binding protein